MTHIAGIPVIVSAAATEEWKPREPHTDDMRTMVDDFWRCGLILPRRVPAAYQMLGKLFIHPALMVKLPMRLEGIFNPDRYLE